MELTPKQLLFLRSRGDRTTADVFDGQITYSDGHGGLYLEKLPEDKDIHLYVDRRGYIRDKVYFNRK